MIDTFLAWAQAFMLQVALAVRSGRSLAVPAISSLFFLYVLLRGIRPLPISRFWKAVSVIPAFLGAFHILIYLSLSRMDTRPDGLQTLLVILSLISAVVILWALLLICRDICLACRFLFRRLAHREEAGSAFPNPDRRRFLLNGGLLLSAGVMGGLGVRNALGAPKVIPTVITLPHLPLSLDGLRIVQLSDLHVSDVVTRAWVRDVVEKVNALQPDLIVLTGDFVDGHPRDLMENIEPLADLRARCGVHACTGNHDFYSGLGDWLPRFRQLGLGVLRNEHVVLDVNGTPLTLIGLHDLTERVRGQGPDPAQAVKGAPEEGFRILLEHHPQEAPNRASFADLMLCGHTHGGQIPLLAPLIRRANNGFVAGIYHVGDMILYVNRGTGVWGGLPLRLGVPAEISLLTLRRGA